MSGTASTCCLALYRTLGDMVIFPGSDSYTASLSSYFSSQQANEYPDCIVYPETAQNVSTAVNALTIIPNTTSDCQFAVRSGGHAFTAGASNIASGVTIDLKGLHALEISPDSSTASLGVGLTWDAVYAQLDHLNLSVAGGRAAGVGVGGLTIGGGLPWHGPRYGFTCDTVKNFEFVLYNGSIVNVNDNENPELLWALRGGTNNFGIVFIMPLPVLKKLQLPMKRKLQLFTLFATALFGVAASVIALVFRIKLLTTNDSTWHQAELALCVFAENNTAILVGCMPAFAKFVKFVGSSIASRRSRSNQNLVQGSDNSFKHEAWKIQMPPPLPHSNGRAGSFPLLGMDNNIRNIQSRIGKPESHGPRIFTSKRYGLQTICNL
ncbi:oxidoreductase [Diaporthe eres]|nr:oxidoreductase [Diaporthe eres]